MRIFVFTHDFEDLGGGDGVKVRELVADLAPEDAARVHGDGVELHPTGAASCLLKYVGTNGIPVSNEKMFCLGIFCLDISWEKE